MTIVTGGFKSEFLLGMIPIMDNNRKLLRCGMDAWLVKPTSKKQIVDAVEQGMKALSVAA
jgi:hypothetical protein